MAGQVTPFVVAPQRAGFTPERRKKFITPADTQGPCGPMPAGNNGFDPTSNGFVANPALTWAGTAGSAIAARQFETSALKMGGFASIGRFRCRPPLKLYAILSAVLWPKSCSTPRFAWCEYAYWKFFAVGKPNGRMDNGTPAVRKFWFTKTEFGSSALNRCSFGR